MSSNKVVSLDELGRIAASARAAGRRVVLCHGVFDLMHSGHIFHLQRARKEGDLLFVTVTCDSHVNKGPGRPVFAENLRAETIAALGCVDHVAVNYSPTAIEVIDAVKPAVYVKGGEYRSAADDLTGGIIREIGAVESHGGRFFFTDEETFSSSALLNEHFGVFPATTKMYLDEFKQSFTAAEVIARLQSLRDLRVLVIGDAIIDQYHYTSQLGQSGKSLATCVKYESAEQFAGGSIAVANHVAGFCKSVTLMTALGRQDSQEAFIREKLSSNVSPSFVYFDDAPTVTKRRFVDDDLTKMFEVYYFNEEPNLDSFEDGVIDFLSATEKQFDLILAADFGNGFISQRIANKLCDGPGFLAVNTQINSGNRGYHVVNRYRRADFISLNEPEIRLAAHNRHSPLPELMKEVGDKHGSRVVAVTRGTKGAVLAQRPEGAVTTIPALSTKVVDRIGAGDAFLSLAAISLAGGHPMPLAGFVGAAAAAIDVQIVCNREPIDPVALFKYITTLLK
jgi:rfaE bifunctional protein nucleotidyltransferase chain/domain